tara:strand:+ start:279 stop:500 length:222 start_codon:yes stop_codon:yes gene_type:complete
MQNEKDFLDGQDKGISLGLALGGMLGLGLGMIIMSLETSMPLDLTYSEYTEYVEQMKDAQQDYYDENPDNYYY